MVRFQQFISFLRLDTYEPVAQLAEHATFNRGVESSSLSRLTKKLNTVDANIDEVVDADDDRH